MRKMSVRDIRQHWPDAERALRSAGEIIVTRDAHPVARLLPLAGREPAAKQRFDPEALRRWRERFWRTQPPQPPTGVWLDHDRADR